MGFNINLTPNNPPEWWLYKFGVKASPPKKPRARQLRDGRWLIHTGDSRQPFAVGYTLESAFSCFNQRQAWIDLANRQGKERALEAQKQRVIQLLDNVIMAGTSGSRGMRNFITEAKRAYDEIRSMP